MLASYALAVTFARGGYVGYVGAVAVLVLAVAIPWLRQRAGNVGRLAVAAVLGLAGLAVVMPIVSGLVHASPAGGHAVRGRRRASGIGRAPSR